MLTESGLQNYLKRAAKSSGVLYFKLLAVGRTGWPDVFLIKGGRIILVELKSPRGHGRLSARQIYLHKLLTDAGAELYVIDSKKDADTIIGKFNNARPNEGD